MEPEGLWLPFCSVFIVNHLTSWTSCCSNSYWYTASSLYLYHAVLCSFTCQNVAYEVCIWPLKVLRRSTYVLMWIAKKVRKRIQQISRSVVSFRTIHWTVNKLRHLLVGKYTNSNLDRNCMKLVLVLNFVIWYPSETLHRRQV